jgi:nitronate monooxygenase
MNPAVPLSRLFPGLALELPIVQAGMGDGLATHELAAAVSEAGGLGTIGILPPEDMEAEIASARRLTGMPLAVNLIVPFSRRSHWEVAAGADVVVTHWEASPRRRVAGTWIHTIGDVEEAETAVAAGADAVIAQGVEAGGHVRGTVPAAELLERIRGAIGPEYPVLSAGGVAGPAEVRDRLEAGAEGVVAGTRFLMSEESGAHPEYKERLLGARETVLTELFGLGWPAPHRVVPNPATDRWLRGDRRGPAWVRAIHRMSAFGASRVPSGLQLRLAASQRPSRPLFGPAAATADGPRNLVDAGPLYAGKSIERIADIRPAAVLVRELAS